MQTTLLNSSMNRLLGGFGINCIRHPLPWLRCRYTTHASTVFDRFGGFSAITHHVAGGSHP